jgi:hypothetical protein
MFDWLGATAGSSHDLLPGRIDGVLMELLLQEAFRQVLPPVQDIDAILHRLSPGVEREHVRLLVKNRRPAFSLIAVLTSSLWEEARSTPPSARVKFSGRTIRSFRSAALP